MSFKGLSLTENGSKEIAKAETGETFRIESVVFGDGIYSGSNMKISAMVNQVMELPVSKVTRNENQVFLEVEYCSKDVTRAFYFREIGIMANHMLCFYDNCGHDAEYIDPESDNFIKQKRIRVILYISSAAEISVTIPSQLYALEEDLLNHANDEKNPHNVTKQQIGLENVPNVTTNNQTPTFEENTKLENLKSGEKLSTLMGKLMKAVATVIDHIGNKSNPHNVTKNQIGLGNVENTSDVDKPISTKQQQMIDATYQQATGYTDKKVADLINGAPSTLDTLGEIAKAMSENQGVVEALNSAIGTKADQAELDGHMRDNSVHITDSERKSWNGKAEKNGDASNMTETFSQTADLANIATGEKHSTIFGKISKAIATLITHVSTSATASVAGHVKVDSALSTTSTNPPQNKTVTAAIYARLPKEGDASDTTVSYTDASELAELSSGEKLSTAFGKLKLAVKNVISITKLLGTTDITGIGGGTVTGAISALNSNLPNKLFSGTALSVNVPYGTLTNIASVGLPDAGTYLIIGSCQVQSTYNSVYQISLIVHGGNQFALTRNISMIGGGGGNVIGVRSVSAGVQIDLCMLSYNKDYDVVPGYIMLYAIKIC